ncbi:MAG: helix-turn-helix domain-containing protein [Solobacterium sp.]|nr:helix-turn-helix domain-containing protein [Solobacterium sp.]
MIQINLIQKRLLSELYNEMPYSSKTLGNLLGVSDRTIRNEIIKLNEVLKDHGAQIAAKARTGCELEVTDRAAFSKFCAQLGIDSEYMTRIPEYLQLAHALIRTIICSEKPLHLADLAEMYYTNITTVKNAVTNAREILREYHLSITNSRNGLQILGREHDIRILLVNEYNFMQISDMVDTSDEAYRHLFSFDPLKMVQIMSAVAEVQMNFDSQNYNLSIYSIRYIAGLILISEVRQKKGHVLEYDSRTVLNLTEYRSYLVATQLAARLHEILGYKPDEMHTVLLTMCFAGLRIIRTYTEEISKNYLVCRRFAIELIDYLSDINHFGLLRNDNVLINNVSYYLMSYMMRADHGIVTSQFSGEHIRQMPPMAQKLSMQAFFYLYREYQLPYSKEEIHRLANIFHPALGRNRSQIIQLNACVVSKTDMTAGAGTAERLKRNFGSILNKVDVFELYQLRNIDLSEYDVMFTTYEESEVRMFTDQPLPHMYHLGLFFHTIDKNRIYAFLTSVLNYKSNLNTPYRFLNQKNLYYGVKASNEQECLRLLCEYLENDIDNAQQLQSELEIMEYTMPSDASNNVVMVSGLLPHADKTMLSIMVLEKPVLWGYKVNKAQIIVYWDQGMNDTMSSLFEFGYLPNFIQHVCSRQEFIEALIAGESCDRINEMIAGYQTVTF